MDSTPNAKTIEPDDDLIARADEHLAHAYEQIARADEQIARVNEQVSKLEHDAARNPSAALGRLPSRGRPMLRSIGSICRGCGPDEGQAGTRGEAAQRCSRMCNAQSPCGRREKTRVVRRSRSAPDYVGRRGRTGHRATRAQYLSRSSRFQTKFIERRHSVPATRPGKS